jgi:hypothetical protein
MLIFFGYAREKLSGLTNLERIGRILTGGNRGNGEAKIKG